MKDNSFKLTKERSRRYSTQTITDADYADDTALLANTPAKAEALQHNLERAAACIGIHVNVDDGIRVFYSKRRQLDIKW